MAEARFKIIIVGAGIGGLAACISMQQANRDITVFEASGFLRELGAGISLQPNATRIIQSWGALEYMKTHGGSPDRGMEICDNQGRRVKEIRFEDSEHGHERLVFHRVDLHDNLKHLALNPKDQTCTVKLELSTRIVACDPVAGSVTAADGREYNADLIIGADGIHSNLRRTVVGPHVQPLKTGLAAYRILLSVDQLHLIPEAMSKMDPSNPWTTMLIDAQRRVVLGPNRNATCLSIVAIIPDDRLHETPGTSWTSEGSLKHLLESFEGFPEWILQVFRKAESLALWQLRDLPPLPQWCEGRVALMGDAAHAMLPLQGQGASQSFEDAEALGHVFKSVRLQPGPEEISRHLDTYFHGRVERASLIQAYSRSVALPPLPGQEQRFRDPTEFQEYNYAYEGLAKWLDSHPDLDKGRDRS